MAQGKPQLKFERNPCIMFQNNCDTDGRQTNCDFMSWHWQAELKISLCQHLPKQSINVHYHNQLLTTFTSTNITQKKGLCIILIILLHYLGTCRLDVLIHKLVSRLKGSFWYDLLTWSSSLAPFFSKHQVHDKRWNRDYRRSPHGASQSLGKFSICYSLRCHAIKDSLHIFVLYGVTVNTSNIFHMYPRKPLIPIADRTTDTKVEGEIHVFDQTSVTTKNQAWNNLWITRFQ